MWTVNFQIFKLDLEKAEDQRSNCQHPLDHQKSKRVPEKHLFLLYWLPNPLTMWITTNCRKFWKKGIPDHLTCILRNLFAGQEATVRTRHGTTDWFQIGKAVQFSSVQSLSCVWLFATRWITARHASLSINNFQSLLKRMYSFSYLEPVCCSMSSSNCCFLTCIKISQEAG